MNSKSLLLALINMMFSLCFVSCNKSVNEIPEGMEQAPKKMVGVVTRSASTIEYPVTLYAFNAAGELVQSVTAEEEDDVLEMELTVGSYHLVAMAGTSGLEEVASPASDASIGVPEDGLIESAVQMGSADISVASEDVNVNIAMSYQVAQVDVELQDIPTDVEEVSITLSSIYKDENFYGTMSGGKAVTIPLTKKEGSDGIWCSSTVYTLPGSSSQLTLSISMDNETYAYTHSSNLKAATPYTLIGSFVKGFTLTGTVTAAGWGEAEEITFTFGEESRDDTPADTPDDELTTVSEFPVDRSAWEGHFVAMVTKNEDETEAELLLLSLREWEVTSDEIATTVESYDEKGITDWRMITEEEMKNLTIFLGHTSQLENVNETIKSIGGTKLAESPAGYYCGDGTKYAQMGSDYIGRITSTESKYRLRLVKTVTVVKSE